MSDEHITLEQLQNNSEKQEVKISDIREYEKKEVPPTIIDYEFNKLHQAVLKEKDKIDEVKQKAYDEIEEAERLKEEANMGLDDNDELGSIFSDEEKGEPEPKKVVVNKYSSIVDEEKKKTKESEKNFKDLEEDDNDFLNDISFGEEEEEDDIEEEEKQEERLRKIRKVVAAKINPYDNAVDLSKFTISKKSINASKVINMAPVKEDTADWALYSSKQHITMRALNGSEIQKMDTTSNSRSTLNAYKEIYRIIYDHIVMDDKPGFESWLKTTRYSDDDDIFFAAYMATFNRNHSIPFTCPDEKCNEVFMEDINFSDLVKYKDDEVKKEVEFIRNHNTNIIPNSYETELVQISDDYVVALRNPSLYHVLFEPRILSQELIEKYRDLIGLLSYIDSIYYIDKENNELIEIDTKPDPRNAAKTAVRRYKEYYKILSTLTSDQQAVLDRAVFKIDEDNNKVSYILPEVTCPKCGKVIPASETTPITLLFMRHRVAKLADF